MTVKSIPKQYLPVKDETEVDAINVDGLSNEKQQILLNKLLRRKLHQLQNQHRPKDKNNLFFDISLQDKNNTMMMASGSAKNNSTTAHPQTDSDQYYESRVLKETIKPAEGE